ncbi:hypothetical protein MTR67_001365 [Solanum verrucosum]|uniref:Tf2-1-like SH3-like domain-containing protein n=1 Tax=Solanum verrucosum TaxID=315347 RepID=A0AAF0PRQ9_SOLVR|nr:hypothetical protein MTR67_001365 [Solanum verrucosum]
MINMDFITGLPRFRRQHDSIWVIVDRMTKSAHFLPIKTTHSAEDYFKLYIQELTDGKAERTVQTLEDMWRGCVIDFKGNWDDYLPLIEFSYNNSYHSIIQMAPYEALYGRRELEFEVDDWVYLKVLPMKGVMRFGKKVELSPWYIEPYQISKRIGKVAYELELPQELAAANPVFHISMLKKCMGKPSLILPTEDIEIKDSLSYEEIHVQNLDRQDCKLRTKEVASVKVLWRNQFVEEAT